MKNYTNFHKSTYIHTHLLEVTYTNLHKPTSIYANPKSKHTWTEASATRHVPKDGCCRTELLICMWPPWQLRSCCNSWGRWGSPVDGGNHGVDNNPRRHCCRVTLVDELS